MRVCPLLEFYSRRPQWKLLPVDIDCTSYPGRFPKLLCNPDNGFCRNRGDLLNLVQRVVLLHVLLNQIKRRPALYIINRKGTFDGCISDILCIVFLRLAVRIVPDQRLVAVLVPYIMPRSIYQIGRVGAFLQVFFVVNPQIIDKNINHTQGQCRIGSRNNRNPFIRLGGCMAAYRVNNNEFGTPPAGIRHFSGRCHRVVVHAMSELGPPEDNVVTMFKVYFHVYSAHRNAAECVKTVPAGHREIFTVRSPESGSECMFYRRVVEVEMADDELPRILFTNLFHFCYDGVHRLFPTDLHPFWIDTDSLFRIGPLHRFCYPVRIIELSNSGLPFSANLPSRTAHHFGISLDINDFPTFYQYFYST